MAICVYGLFKSSAEYAQELFLKTGSSEFPSSPGVLALSYPYEGVVIVIDASCPARYLNCIQGRLTPDKKQLTHNVIIEMDPNPMILATDPNKGLQAMFKIKCITDISADNECVSYYGAAYYAATKKILYLLEQLHSQTQSLLMPLIIPMTLTLKIIRKLKKRNNLFVNRIHHQPAEKVSPPNPNTYKKNQNKFNTNGKEYTRSDTSA